MRIGFDLDNIFINHPPFIPGSIIERLYRKKTNGSLEYRIPSHYEQFVRRISHAAFLRPPIKSNLEILSSIQKNKHLLYLVSSRFGFLKKPTEQLVKKYKLNSLFSELYFNFHNKQPHEFKDEIIRKLKIDIYIDDDLYLLKYIAGKNNKVKLFWLNNKNNKRISQNITAITSLKDIFKE